MKAIIEFLMSIYINIKDFLLALFGKLEYDEYAEFFVEVV